MQQVSLTEDQIQAELAKGNGVFEVMGVEGDIKSIWNPSNADEVQEARQQFERLTKEKKFKAYKVVGTNGERGEPMREFDAQAGRVIFVPQMQGG